MVAISPENLTTLKNVLDQEYVPHLLPLLPNNKSAEDNISKNTSRSLSAFVISKLCKIDAVNAAQSVVDDFNDCGIDAIYYDFTTKTLYFIQSKLIASEQFKQADALAFIRGVRKLITYDFEELNENITNRETDIRDALGMCVHIQVVVAYTGDGMSVTARQIIDELLSDTTHGDIRLSNEIIEFNADKIVESLVGTQAYKQVDCDFLIEKCTNIENPRITYFGLINLGKLIELHNNFGEALFEKNIRTFLGRETDVNLSIRNTLAENPENFVYFNNGITVLCKEIHPKGLENGKRKLEVKKISVVNGAQTIVSSAKFCEDNAENDVSSAKVSITVILDDGEEAETPFGELVTRARNHQNPVFLSDFVALDEQQEKLRRAIALLHISYIYKAVGANRIENENHIYVDEAAQALPVLSNDFRFTVYLKKNPVQLLNRDSDNYKNLFADTLTPSQVVNSVRLNRYVQRRITEIATNAPLIDQENLIYRNGNYVLAWILAKRVIGAINSGKLIDDAKLRAELGAPLDELRLTLFNQTRRFIAGNSVSSFFQNQAQVKNLIKNIMIEHFGITINDHLRRFEAANPDGFFEHLIKQAPQIENLV